MEADLLLPVLNGLRLERIQVHPDQVTMELVSTAVSATCPMCGQINRRVHSRYHRTLKDLPWHGTPVRLLIEVRRFFCDNRDCRRGIFTERLNDMALRHGRTTNRLADALVAIGLNCGGEVGARLAVRLGMPTSPDAILQAIRRQLLIPADTPRFLGVDDWALHRGRSYGTILCDLERHRPIELLPDRTNASLAGWLKEHPGVELISRDRADAYSQGASDGAPQATQVADRWHLLHNLHDALVRIAARCHQKVAEAAKAVVQTPTPPPCSTPPASPAPPAHAQPTSPASRLELAKQTHRARRLATYQQVVELHQQGRSQRGIAEELGLSRDLVRRFVRAGNFPERAESVRFSQADQQIDYLRRRWAEGCRNARVLTKELRSQDADLSYFSVRRLVARSRARPWSRDDSADGAARPTNGPVAVPSSNRVAWLLQRSETALDSDEHELVRHLRDLCPDLRDGADLAMEFAGLVREHRVDDLDTWIALASQSSAPPEMTTFAKGLLTDYAAVKAAATLPWSNGQVEGQVNRLKLIKRQMYGRAGFDLLRRRVLAM